MQTLAALGTTRPPEALRATRVACLLALLALAAAAPESSADEWVLTGRADGIESYQRRADGSPLLAVKGLCVIDAPIDRVLAVILDGARVGEWMSGIDDSSITWIDKPVEYLQFTRFDAPWPISDRVFLSRVTVRVEPATYRTVIRYRDSDRAVAAGGAVRGSADGSHYVLEPIDGGARTRFVGVSQADPGGAFPPWFVNWITARWPHATLTALRDHLKLDDLVTPPEIQRLYRGLLQARLAAD